MTFRAQNATVERGFSVANRIKTDLRNRILPQVLEQLFRIRLHPCEVNYDDVHQFWLTSGTRYGVGRATGLRRKRKRVRLAGGEREGVAGTAGVVIGGAGAVAGVDSDSSDENVDAAEPIDDDDDAFHGFDDDAVEQTRLILHNYEELFGSGSGSP